MKQSKTKSSPAPWASVVSAIALVLVAAGCGTTSDIQYEAGWSAALLQDYDRVVVQDFANGVAADPDDEPAEVEAFDAKMSAAGLEFADRLQSHVKQSQAFEDVVRAQPPAAAFRLASTRGSSGPGEALEISGEITRYREGSSAARLLIGMGVGSSYFDAVVLLTDGRTGERIGTIVVDRNSWALGGSLAADQTVGSFMEEAARTVANRLAEARRPADEDT